MRPPVCVGSQKNKYKKCAFPLRKMNLAIGVEWAVEYYAVFPKGDIIIHPYSIACPSKILCALPAFAGQLAADDRHTMDAISRKVFASYDAVSHTLTYIDSVDRKLFSQTTQPRHCLHHLLPRKTSTHCPYSLRKRQRYYQLPVPPVEYTRYKNIG